MSEPREKKRLRINPIEFIVFSIVAAIFFHSVYKLLFDWTGIQKVSLKDPPLSESVLHSSLPLDPERGPAALQERSFSQLEMDCLSENIEKTRTSKIRITGPVCRGNFLSKNARLINTEIINSSTQVKASVFSFDNKTRFSSDYVYLNRGDNVIQFKFTYSGGKIVTRLLTIKYEPNQ